MRKEIVFAIVMGTMFGLLVAFGIIRANKAINKSNSQVTTSNENPEISPTQNSQVLGITLTKPEDLGVETKNPVVFSGISKPQAWIVISLDKSDYILKTNDTGEFNQNIDLTAGLNYVRITAVDDNGSVFEKDIKIVYSTEFNKISGVVATSVPATESADDIQKKVDQKITDALNKPTFYFGTITDITNTSLQLKSDTGEIKQISISDSTNFVRFAKTTTTLKLKDVAIGDYIIAMGYVLEKDVLSSSRVLITTPIQPETKLVLLGKVSSIKKGQITIISASDGKEIEVIPSNTTITTNGDPDNIKKVMFATISEEDTILLVGKAKDSQIEATRIHIISSPEPSPTPTKIL
jgi:hypothetical protein